MSMIYSIATQTKELKFNLVESSKLQLKCLSTDTFGIRLRKIRITKDITTENLSKMINISTQGIISYENDAAYPSPNIILRLYELFGEDIVCDEYIKFIVSDYINRLKLWRSKEGITKKQAAKILGVSENTYLSWENKNSFISKIYFYKLKNILDKIS